MKKMDGTLLEWAQKNPMSRVELAHCGNIILKGLQILHGKRHLFLDMKPENFMFYNSQEHSSSSSSSKKLPDVNFIDFAFACSFTEIQTGEHREMMTGCAINGTPGYVSMSVHEGNTPSRRDDLEALGNVLLSLAYQGILPWLQATSADECLNLKKSADMIKIADTVGCIEIGQFLHQVI